MPVLFCSAKLSKLLALKTRLPSLSMNNWNGHQFSFKGRKCLIFVHKETLYSFVLFDFLKKDLLNVRKVFIENFIEQLKQDHLYNADVGISVRKEFEEFDLSTTDGDRSTIGFINDCIMRILWPDADGNISVEKAKYYVQNNYNKNPLGSRNYSSAIKLMKEKLSSI